METKIIWLTLGLGITIIILRFLLPKIKGEKKEKFFSSLYEWVNTFFQATLLAALIMNFVVQAFKIPSGSMRQTLIEGDHLFVNKFIYGLRIPFTDLRIIRFNKVKRGEIIVFSCPPEALSFSEKEKGVKKDFIKRCIALAGDTVEIQNKKVFVNGKLLTEPYINVNEEIIYPAPLRQLADFANPGNYQKSWEEGKFTYLSGGTIRDNFGPVKVPEGYYLVLGDNRDSSFDSRFWGPLADKYLKGKALLLYWPIKRIKIIK